MKNIVFDLGGVVFARDVRKCPQDFIDFFSFVRAERMPDFWNEYDRGTLGYEQVREALCRRNGCTIERCEDYLQRSIAMQEAVPATERLIGALRAADTGCTCCRTCRASSSIFCAGSRFTGISTARSFRARSIR